MIATVYQDRIHWFWGDTDRLSYPSETSRPPARPPRCLARADSRRRWASTSPISWAPMDSLPQCARISDPDSNGSNRSSSLPDESGRERLMARVSSQKGLEPAYAWHLAVWNDTLHHFEKRITWPLRDGHDSAHPFRATAHGTDYLFLYPDLRVAALGCGDQPGALRSLHLSHGQRGRGPRRVRIPAMAMAGRSIASGTRRAPARGHRTGHPRCGDRAPVSLNRGSVTWNAYRKRWIRIASGEPGQIWYSEALAPTGPWESACASRRVAARLQPLQSHPAFLLRRGGRTTDLLRGHLHRGLLVRARKRHRTTTTTSFSSASISPMNGFTCRPAASATQSGTGDSGVAAEW